MSTNLKYFQLMQQIEKNPLRPMAAPAFDIASDFRRDMEELEQNRKWSPEGRRDEAQKHLRKALRDLRDMQKPLDEYRSKTATMSAVAKRPPIDKGDFVAALARRELREASRAMKFGQRTMRMTGARRSTAFLDAILEFEDDPWMSGIDIDNPNELEVYELAKRERLRDFHGPLLDQIAERDSMEKEVRDLIIAVARGDIQNDSGLESRDFEALARPIETRQGAPWLRKEKDFDGNERVIVIDVQNHRSRVATEREILDGKF
jgi:hypothetical protein